MTDDYEEKSDQIRNLAQMPPEGLADHLSALHKNMNGAAPEILPHIQTAAVNAIQYLNSKLPQHSNDLVQDVPKKIPESEKLQWLQLHKVINDPVSILDHVQKGTLTQPHIDALKAVYPDLHQEMSQKMGERLGLMKMNGEEMPYQKRRSISQFMGQPLDSTMTQQAMQTIMMANAPKGRPQQASGAQKKPSEATANSMQKLDKMYQTPNQARAASRSTSS